MNKISREPNESFTDYQFRLYRNKEANGYTWSDIADILNEEYGYDWGADKYRKYLTVFNDGYEYAIEKSVTSSEEAKKLDEKIKEFEIKKIQFQDQKREYRSYLRHEGRLDNLLSSMISEFEEQMDKKPLQWYNRVSATGSKKAGVLMLSDLHAEMVTDNFWNEFNEDVFNERLSQVITESIEYKDTHDLDSLHIMALGDMIHGVLHRLTRIKETETATQATQRVAEKLSEMVAELANHYPEVYFYSIAGNHDRTASRKDEEIRTETFFSFIPWYMEARLKDIDNTFIVKNEIDSEIIVAEILGNTYFGVHGHLDNLGKVVTDLTMMLKKFPVAVLSAHIHKNFENEIHKVDLIVNGGFAGTDDYAKDRRLTSKAHQKFLIVDEKGRKSTEYIRF